MLLESDLTKAAVSRKVKELEVAGDGVEAAGMLGSSPALPSESNNNLKGRKLFISVFS